MRGEGGPPQLVYVGTAPGPRSKGLQCFRLQTEELEVSQNITLAPLGQSPETASAGFFEIDPRRRFLFTLDERGKQAGSFGVDAQTGKLTAIDRKPVPGAGPCHLVADQEGRWLVIAARDGVSVLPVSADGHLGAPSETVALGGKARAQGVALDAGSRMALVCDGGQERVAAYRFDAGRGKLAAAGTLAIKGGPRRAVFRADGRFAYVTSGRATVTVVSCDAGGALKEVASAATVPEYYDGPNEATEIALHPSGQFLYVSNRGHNSVVLFTVDEKAGTISYVEEQGTGGKNPTHFGLARGAKHLALGNQDSDTVLVCRIDAGNGRLKPSGVFTTVPAPTCVRFL
jgi:6-phosphogluconolactonase